MQWTRKCNNETDLLKTFRMKYKSIAYVVSTSSNNRFAETTRHYHCSNTEWIMRMRIESVIPT